MSVHTTERKPRGPAVRFDAPPSIDASPAPNDSIEDNATKAIAQLFAEHGALNITHWKADDLGVVRPNSDHESSHPELLLKTSELAKRAIEQGTTVSRLFSSRHQQFMVASPIVSDRGYAITVAFPLVNDAHLQERSNVQCRDVALLAAQLTIVRLNDRIRRKDTASGIPQAHTQLQSTEADSSHTKSVESVAPRNWPRAIIRHDDASAASPTKFNATTDSRSDKTEAETVEPARTSPSSWLEIAVQVRTKLLAALKSIAANRKMVAASVVGVGLIAALPWPHTIKTQVVCEPANRRFVAAPFDCKLLEALVVPGDEVDKGAVLATLDGGELRSEIAALEAKLGQAKQRRAAALTKRDASKAEFERMEIRHLQGELDLAYSRQTNLEIVSPIQGIVVSGDLERAEGATLSTGDTLFEVAPLEEIVAEIAIPEAEISYVNHGLSTSITFDGSHGTRFESTLTSIHPRSEIRDGDNVFIAEAALDNNLQLLKPGMHGSARISAGNRPLIWILFHKPYEAVRHLIGW